MITYFSSTSKVEYKKEKDGDLSKHATGGSNICIDAM